MDVIKLYCDEDYIETELKNIKTHYNDYKFCSSQTDNTRICPESLIRHLESSLDIVQEIKEKKDERNQGI